MAHPHRAIVLAAGLAIALAFAPLVVPPTAVRAADRSPPNQTGAPATPAGTLSDEERAAGFKSLFDGHSTDAWRAWDGKAFPKKGWVVEDGCLKCEASNGRPNGGGGDLVTRDEFVAFDLRWEWKISPKGNSGLKYFLRKQGKEFVPLYAGDKGKDYLGHEYQMLDDEGHPDGKRGGNHVTGSFYDILPPNDTKAVRPVGQFNESRILVRGDHVEHWLNGKKVVEFDLGSETLNAAIQKSKYHKLPGFGTKIKTAFLLQDHGTEVWFRNVRVRDLSADAPAK